MTSLSATRLHFNSLLAAGHIRVTQGSFKAVAVPDPMTNNYRFKLGQGRIERLEPATEKGDFKGPSLKPRGLA